jgi:hypothetical protein
MSELTPTGVAFYFDDICEHYDHCCCTAQPSTPTTAPEAECGSSATMPGPTLLPGFAFYFEDICKHYDHCSCTALSSTTPTPAPTTVQSSDPDSKSYDEWADPPGVKTYVFKLISEQTGRPVFQFRFCVSGLLYLMALIALFVFALYLWYEVWVVA